MTLPDILTYLADSYRAEQAQSQNLAPEDVVLPPAVEEFLHASRQRMQQNQVVSLVYDESGPALRLQDSTLLRYAPVPELPAFEPDSPAIPIMRSTGGGPGIGGTEGRSWQAH